MQYMNTIINGPDAMQLHGQWLVQQQLDGVRREESLSTTVAWTFDFQVALKENIYKVIIIVFQDFRICGFDMALF